MLQRLLVELKTVSKLIRIIAMKKISILFSLLILFFATLMAQTENQVASDSIISNQQAEVLTQIQNVSKADADSAYIKEDYATAISIYENLLKKGVSAEIYYNLGNSYYKAGDIARAILNYERAVLLSPNNSDYNTNLDIASAKKVDKDEYSSEIFIISWGKSIVNLMSSDQWAIFSVIVFIIFLVGLSLFVFSKKSTIKKTSFVFGLCALILVPITNYCASYQRNKILSKNTAIVLEPSVTVRSTPSETGTSLFVIHEGKKVNIKDGSMTSWKEIELENGQVGWIPTEVIEVI